jgi:putative transcriptional regulator
MHRVLAALLLALAVPAAAEPEKPLLLVAAPGLQGFYRQATLVAVPLGEIHIGFIVNRPTETRLGALFPNHPPSAKVVAPVYLGGPEMPQAIFAVVPRNPGTRSLALFGGLFVAGHTEIVDRIIEQAPNEARFFAGFVAWQPGELSREIGRGWWYVGEPEPELLFRADPAGLWEELVERLGADHLPPAPPGTLRRAAMRSASKARCASSSVSRANGSTALASCSMWRR